MPQDTFFPSSAAHSHFDLSGSLIPYKTCIFNHEICRKIPTLNMQMWFAMSIRYHFLYERKTNKQESISVFA